MPNPTVLMDKLRILTDAAKYDVACTSSGLDRKGQAGGLGSAVAEVLAEHCPVPMERIGAVDFAESGDYGQLMEKYGYGPESIAQRCRAVMRRKQDNGTGRLPERTLRPFDMP